MNPKVPMDAKVQRSIAEAEPLAEDTESSSLRAQRMQEVAEAKRAAAMIGTQRVTELRARATSEGASAFERNGEIVSESRSMAADLRSGRVSIDDARKRHRQLSIAHRLTRTQVDLFEQDLARAAEIEANPVEYTDDLYRRFPTTRPSFGF